MNISPSAGKLPEQGMLTDIPKLITSYYTEQPDMSVPAQRVSFGTSGHRGTSFAHSFNENHILAISQAICLYRSLHKTEGPLFLGIDTHALSFPAYATALEVFAANNVQVILAEGDEYTPTPVISHAILSYNKGRMKGLADGVIITPSHNPPADGGFKYNPVHGGPAGTGVTKWIETKANEILESGLKKISRIPFERALKSGTVRRINFIRSYVEGLQEVLDMKIIRDSDIRIGVDPLGGAGVHYWKPIAERYKLNLEVVNEVVDPTFRFMTLDWDGQIRMDPSSSYAMRSLIKLKDKFDISMACDTDHDRHGIVTRSKGLIPPNQYLSVAIQYLLRNRTDWNAHAAIGKTLVSSSMIDRVTADAKRKLFEVPVGFKWFVEGLQDESLCFGGEESAGASFSRKDGSVWTTDKDGFIPALLAAEITAKSGRDPGELYEDLTRKFGTPVYDRIEAPATAAQKNRLSNLSASEVKFNTLGGEKILAIQTEATGNKAAVGGLKVITENGWFAARPSGTENIYKIYAESFLGESHLKQIQQEAQGMIDKSLTGAADLKHI
jgi:phosphoglucomutase